MGKKEPFYQELDAYARQTTQKNVVAYINMKLKQNPQLVFPAAGWLRDNTVGQRDGSKMNAMYFLSYSDVLSNISAAYYRKNGETAEADKTAKAAFSALGTFELMGLADAARCEGPESQSVLMPLLGSRYDGLKYVYRLLSPQEYAQQVRLAIATESRAGGRAPNEMICTAQAADAVPLDKKEWDARRAQTQAAFNAFMRQRYEEETGVKVP